MNLKNTLFLSMACTGLSAVSAQQAISPNPQSRHIDLAICLDTSGSMDGLIDSARQNIWTIVNDLALIDPAPALRVSLLTFGNDGHPAEEGWVRVDLPFTDDLDKLSQQLFALRTNGGTELVARVTQRALSDLTWTEGEDALKIVVVAGNESARQDDKVALEEVCKRASERGIILNSIYCGPAADQLAPHWREVATLAEGAFATIEADEGAVVIPTPFDEKLTELSAEVNKTYVPYGQEGRTGWANQWRQDANASGLSGANAAQRAITKVTCNYYCGSWDLVDALDSKTVKLEDVEREHLPEELRALSVEKLQEHIDAKKAQRTAIREQIAALRTKADAFRAVEMEKLKQAGKSSLEFAVRSAIRKQAEARGFIYKKPTVVAVAGAKAIQSEAATEKPKQGR